MMIDDDDGYDGYEAFYTYTCLFEYTYNMS